MTIIPTPTEEPPAPSSVLLDDDDDLEPVTESLPLVRQIPATVRTPKPGDQVVTKRDGERNVYLVHQVDYYGAKGGVQAILPNRADGGRAVFFFEECSVLVG